MDQTEVTFRAEDDRGGLATCGRVMRCHGRVSNDGEAVVVPLTCAKWRGRQGEASGASELVPEGR